MHSFEKCLHEMQRIKRIKIEFNLVKQTSFSTTIKIDRKENDFPSPKGRMVMNCTQPAAAICFLAFGLWCQMPSDTEHTEESAICTDGHQCRKGTSFYGCSCFITQREN